MLIGYARVSTTDQNLAHQLDALTGASVAERDIHIDTASGMKPSRSKLYLVLQLRVRAASWSSRGWAGSHVP